MCLLDIHNRRSGSFSTSFSDFFERIIPAENFAAQFLRVGLFQEAFAKHGGLSENEIFFFAPALAFGGTESIQYVEKGNAVVHQHLLFEMGADHSDDTAGSTPTQATASPPCAPGTRHAAGSTSAISTPTAWWQTMRFRRRLPFQSSTGAPTLMTIRSARSKQRNADSATANLNAARKFFSARSFPSDPKQRKEA